MVRPTLNLLLLWTCFMALAGLLPAYGEEEELAMLQDTVRTDIDVTVPRVRIRQPMNEVTLSVMEKLPSRLYIYTNAEPSLRLETNPYQSIRGKLYAPFRDNTDVFRIQTDTTVGYALSPSTRISANYYLLSDHYNDFTPFHLDNAVQGVTFSAEHDLLTTEKWLLRGTVQSRQLFLGDGNRSGDVLPSMTLMRRLGNNGYSYVNTALDLNRKDFILAMWID